MDDSVERDKDQINSTIEIIRNQSRIKSSDFRKIYASQQKRYFQEDPVGQKLAHLILERGRQPSYGKTEEFEGEDSRRDSEMITSADFLDLYLAELHDAETLGPSMFSRRTEHLLEKVREGLIKGMEINTLAWQNTLTKQGVEKEMLNSFRDRDPYYIIKRKLEAASSLHESMYVIENFRDIAHRGGAEAVAAPGATNIPIRDLYWTDQIEDPYGRYFNSAHFFVFLGNIK